MLDIKVAFGCEFPFNPPVTCYEESLENKYFNFFKEVMSKWIES